MTSLQLVSWHLCLVPLQSLPCIHPHSYTYICLVFHPNLSVDTHTQTVDDFHDEYDRLFNSGRSSEEEDDDDEEDDEVENLLRRSFTEDIMTPLNQIKVCICDIVIVWAD